MILPAHLPEDRSGLREGPVDVRCIVPVYASLPDSEARQTWHGLI